MVALPVYTSGKTYPVAKRKDVVILSPFGHMTSKRELVMAPPKLTPVHPPLGFVPATRPMNSASCPTASAGGSARPICSEPVPTVSTAADRTVIPVEASV